MNCATASTARSTPVDSPYVALNASDTICFRVGTIMRATDSLWAAVDHRERLRIAAMVIAGMSGELQGALSREAAQSQRAKDAERLVSGAIAGEAQAIKDRDFWQVRAGRNTKKGIGIGVGISVAAFFGGREVWRRMR